MTMLVPSLEFYQKCCHARHENNVDKADCVLCMLQFYASAEKYLVMAVTIPARSAIDNIAQIGIDILLHFDARSVWGVMKMRHFVAFFDLEAVKESMKQLTECFTIVILGKIFVRILV